MRAKACSIRPAVTALSRRCWALNTWWWRSTKWISSSLAKRFNEIREDYLTFAEQLPGNLDIRFVPLSALEGDNVASQSANMPWYSGPTLLEVLETVEIQRVVESQPLRFPVQYVNRPNLDFRGFSGTVASGTVKVGQRLKVLPSGVESSVARIVTFDGDLQEAAAGKPLPLC
jgi:sulfate adenylyltransferase subunit 1